MIHKLRSIDHPEADGRIPQDGDLRWTLSVPLEGGMDYLNLEIGKKGREAIRMMLKQEDEDDTRESKGLPLQENTCRVVDPP